MLYQLDAFASRPFTGNPAALMLLPHFFDDAMLQAIAGENNLSETAFLVERITPGRTQVVFHTASGPLKVTRAESSYRMDFPRRAMVPVATAPALVTALGLSPLEVLDDSGNHIAVLASAQQVRELIPDLAAIAQLDRTGVVVTAPGDAGFDFISRYFAPAKGIPEDPVTGGAHTALAPFWAARLGRTVLSAYQASQRGGEVRCSVLGDRVELEGRCVFYLEGQVEL